MRCRPCGAPKNGGDKCAYCQCEYHHAQTFMATMTHAEHNAASALFGHAAQQQQALWNQGRSQLMQQMNGGFPLLGGLGGLYGGWR